MPGFHLDKGDSLALADDEVDVVSTEPEAVRLDAPPAGGEEGDGQPFSREELTALLDLAQTTTSTAALPGAGGHIGFGSLGRCYQ